MLATRLLLLSMVAFATAACSEVPPAGNPNPTVLAPGGRQAPAGYSWKKAHCMYVLIPDGWFYKEQEGHGTKAFFVSKESIEKEGKFKTGLTSNMITAITAKTGYAPSDYASRLFDSLKQTASYQDIQSTAPTANIAQLSGYFRTKHPASRNISVQYLTTLANNKTGTLYIVQFETREADWDSTLPVAKVLINNLVADDAC